MKRVRILQIVRAFGAAGIEDLIVAGREWGDPFLPADLAAIEELGLVRNGDGKLRMAKQVEKVDDEKLGELLHYFHDADEFGAAAVVKALGVSKEIAKQMCDKLEKGKKIKVKRQGKYFGRSFPLYTVVVR